MYPSDIWDEPNYARDALTECMLPPGTPEYEGRVEVENDSEGGDGDKYDEDGEEERRTVFCARWADKLGDLGRNQCARWN